MYLCRLKRFCPIKKENYWTSIKQRRLFLSFLFPNFFSEINMLRIWTSRTGEGGGNNSAGEFSSPSFFKALTPWDFNSLTWHTLGGSGLGGGRVGLPGCSASPASWGWRRIRRGRRGHPIPAAQKQSYGPVTFWWADQYLWLMDPDPDPTPFFIDFKNEKNNFFHIFRITCPPAYPIHFSFLLNFL
jgi:hypothetical protein